MNTKQALRVVMRQAPCQHEMLETRIGDGTTWVRCEDCRAMIASKDLPAIRKRASEFEDAIDVLQKACVLSA